MPTVTIGNNTSNTYSGCEDNFIWSSLPTTNYGNNDVMSPGISAGRAGLIKFSGLSNILPYSSVSNAVLYLKIRYLPDTTNMIFTAHRVLQNWSETQSTWNIYSTGNNWNTAGALGSNTDISSSTSFSQLAAVDDYIYYSFTGVQFIVDVQGIVSGAYPNYGWRIATEDVAQFSSTQGTDGVRPYLAVTYTTEAYNDPTSFTQMFGQRR
jgi:hypothetical protein